MNNIIIFANGKAAIPSIAYLIEQKQNIYVVVDPDDPGEDTWNASLKKFCQANNISFIQPRTFNDKNFIISLRNFSPHIIFSIQCRKIIKKEIIDIVRGEIFNFHFSDLPKNRGCYPGIWHLLNNDRYEAVTLHQLTPGIDDGSIIDKIRKEIDLADTARSIYDWNCSQVLPLFKKNLEKLLSKRYKSIKQDESLASYYSRNSLKFENNFIDWNKPAINVSRFIQAFIFPPYQYPKTRYQKREIEIVAVKDIKKNVSKCMPGTILSIKGKEIEVKVRNGSLLIETPSVETELTKYEFFYI